MKLGTRLLMEGFSSLNKKAEQAASGKKIGRQITARYLKQIRLSFADNRKRTGCHYLKLIMNVMA